MLVKHLRESPTNVRGGQVSYLLLGHGQFGSKHLLMSWVEGQPNSEQSLHHHASEQVYVVVRGRGLMRVGDEAQEVSEGTMIFIPPDEEHSIRCLGSEPLVFVSATSPPFDVSGFDNPERVSQDTAALDVHLADACARRQRSL